MSLVEIYHSKNSTADIDALIKRLIIPDNGSENPEKIAQDELKQRGVFQINSTPEGGPILYDTNPSNLTSGTRPSIRSRKPKTIVPLSETASKPGGSAMPRLADIQSQAMQEEAAESRTSSRPSSTDAHDSEELTDDELGRMFQEQHETESQTKPAPPRPFSIDDIKNPEDLTSEELRRIFSSLNTGKRRKIRRRR